MNLSRLGYQNPLGHSLETVIIHLHNNNPRVNKKFPIDYGTIDQSQPNPKTLISETMDIIQLNIKLNKTKLKSSLSPKDVIAVMS